MIGVVKQAVNKSAGKSGSIGSNSFDWHAANWMQFRTGGGKGIGVPCARQRYDKTKQNLKTMKFDLNTMGKYGQMKNISALELCSCTSFPCQQTSCGIPAFALSFANK